VGREREEEMWKRTKAYIGDRRSERKRNQSGTSLRCSHSEGYFQRLIGKRGKLCDGAAEEELFRSEVRA
jgi:hypothetical protein